MKTFTKCLKTMMVGFGCLAITLTAMGGVTRYVVPPGTPDVTPGSGYTTWATAGTNIQNVVDGSVSTDLIWVSNGVYTVWNEISVTKGVIIQSFGGETIVEAANYPTSTNRCLYVNDAAATMAGLTFRYGNAKASDRTGNGGCVYLYSGTLSNCTAALGTAAGSGGGVFLFLATATMRGGMAASNTSASSGGGVWTTWGTVRDVFVISNSATGNGGGIYASSAGAMVSNCTATLNRSLAGNDGGGMMARGGTVVDCLSSNNYSVNFGGGLVLDGIAVTGLNCRVVNNVANRAAGGLQMLNNSLASGMTVADNATTNPTTSGLVGGGGMYIGVARLLASRISNNQAPYAGGGIRAEGACLISGCTIDGNRSTNYAGGGIYAGVSGILITNCVISNNVSMKSQGGGLYVAAGGVTVLVSTVCNNSAADKGGGIRIGSDCRVYNCTIGPGNTADDGGGIAFYSGGIVSNCTIVGNRGLNGDSGGGFWTISYGELVDSLVISNTALRLGGGGYCNSGMKMRNCLVAGNEATNTNFRGGGLYVAKLGVNTGRIENCTITANKSYYRGGGACFDLGNTGVMVNCIIYGNSTVTGVTAEKDTFTITAGDTNALVFSCFTGLIPPPNMGNTTNDPQFVNAAAGDYRLKWSSPCVNTATNLAWMAGARDLDRMPRIDGGSGLPDMGCYEFVYSGGTVIILR